MKLFHWTYTTGDDKRFGYVIERTEADALAKVVKFMNIAEKNQKQVKIEYVKAGIEEYD